MKTEAKSVEESPTPNQNQDGLCPPYIPWKSFESFIAVLKSTHAPDVIDSGVMPSTMAGGLQRNLRASLKFLGLTDRGGKVSAGFADLISAHGTHQWPAAVKENVLAAYDSIISDLAIERATAAQLETKFKENGVHTGQMLDKTVRFYLHALKSAEVKYSAYWSIRSDSGGARKRIPSPRSVKTRESKQINIGNDRRSNVNLGKMKTELIEFPLHFGDKSTGKICVPPDMNEDDMVLFDATVAVVKAYCARKKPGAN